MMTRTPGGPGRAGGLLFVALLLFVGYLLLDATSGVVRVLLALVLALLLGLVVGSVFRRR